MAFKFKKIEIAEGKGMSEYGVLGVMIFFDPMEFTNEVYKEILKIPEEIRCEYLSEPSFNRVGKYYAMTVASMVPDNLTKQEFFKQIVDVVYNETRAVMNLKSDIPLVRFFSNVVVRVGGL